MILRIFALSVVALGTGALIETAKAAQFFVCEDGRTVEVEFSKLEAAKREDACVAKYFGIELPAKPKAEITLKPAVASGSRQTAAGAIVLPVRRPQPPSLRSSQTSAQRAAGDDENRRMASVEPGDFRKVRIINAKPGGQQWLELQR